MRMNLTWAQVGCILKYTRPAWWMGNAGQPQLFNEKAWLLFSRRGYVARLRKELDLAPYNRFPLTWIMEAADDISYCVADLEDAVEKRIFSVEQLYQHLYDAWGNMKKARCFSGCRKCLGEIALKFLSRSTEDQFFMYLRVNTLNKLVPYAARGLLITCRRFSAGI
jgi:dGTPase